MCERSFPIRLRKLASMRNFALIKLTAIAVVLVCFLNFSDGKKGSRRRNDEDGGLKESDSDRQKLFEGISDPESSAQAINPATVNPYATQLLLQNQAGLLNNPALLGGTTPNRNPATSIVGSGQAAGLGGLGGLGGLNALNALGGLNGNSFTNAAVGGLSAYQNPLLYGGANIPGIGSPDIFSQSAAAAQLYNNPYLALNGAGLSAGINPLLLRGATNLQYPIVAGNPYLAAQALLSPYANYNQLNPYNNFPFASRFGIGVGRSNIGSRTNSNSNNNDE